MIGFLYPFSQLIVKFIRLTDQQVMGPSAGIGFRLTGNPGRIQWPCKPERYQNRMFRTIWECVSRNGNTGKQMPVIIADLCFLSFY